MGPRRVGPGFGARIVRAIACLACAVFFANAAAIELAGVKLEARAETAAGPLVLNGAGVRTRAIFKIYVAGLYLPRAAATTEGILAQDARRIELHMVRSLRAEQLVEALEEGFAQNTAEAELAALKPRIEKLATLMRAAPEIKEGDLVTLDYAAGTTSVGFNRVVKGTIPGEDFNRALMRIWLGDKPVQADLKKALLGGG